MKRERRKPLAVLLSLVLVFSTVTAAAAGQENGESFSTPESAQAGETAEEGESGTADVRPEEREPGTAAAREEEEESGTETGRREDVQSGADPDGESGEDPETEERTVPTLTIRAMEGTNWEEGTVTLTYGEEAVLQVTCDSEGEVTAASSEHVTADYREGILRLTAKQATDSVGETVTLSCPQTENCEAISRDIRVIVGKRELNLLLSLKSSGKQYDADADASALILASWEDESQIAEEDREEIPDALEVEASFDDCHVGEDKTITVTRVGFREEIWEQRYTLSCSPGSFSGTRITAAAVTVTAAAEDKYYDGEPVKVSIDAVSGCEEADAITPDCLVAEAVNAQGEADAAVGRKTVVFRWADTVGAQIQRDYSLPAEGESVEIYRIPLQIDVEVADKEYDSGTGGCLEKISARVAESARKEVSSGSYAQEVQDFLTGITTEDGTSWVRATEITFSQSAKGKDLPVTYGLTWSEKAREAGYDAIYDLPEPESGTKFVAAASITARRVWIQSVTPEERRYDGTVNVAVTMQMQLNPDGVSVVGEVEPALREEVSALSLTGTARMESKNAGTNRLIAFGTDLTLKAEGEVDPSNFVPTDTDRALDQIVTVEIDRAVVFLRLGEVSFEYDEVPEEGIEDVDAVWPDGAAAAGEGQAVRITITGYRFGGSVGETGDPGDTLRREVQTTLREMARPNLALTRPTLDADGDGLEPGLDIGTYADAIGLEGLTETGGRLKAGTNFELQVKEKGDFGELRVLPDTAAYGIRDVTASGSSSVRGNTLYVRSTAFFTLTQSTALSPRVYDSVWLGEETKEGSVELKKNLTESTGVDDLVRPGQSRTLTLVLGKTSGKTAKNLSRGFSLTLHNDASPPEADFAAGEDALSSQDLSGPVTFGIIQRKTVQVDVTVQDTESGLACVKTCVFRGGKGEIDALNGQGLSLREDWDWKEREGYTRGTDKPFTVSASARVAADTYAVVFVYLEDAVGNAAVYGSNGIVVEKDSPNEPVITYSTEKNYGEGVYRGDVTVEICASERLESEQDIASGLKSVTYTIFRDGKALPGYCGIELFPDDLEESIRKGNVTLSELQGKTSMNLKKKIKIPAADFNSNDVYVSVKVTDQAGNCTESRGETIRIDVTPPSVHVTYSRNNPVNTCYFGKARKMTIVYTERNFSLDKAVFRLTTQNRTYRHLSFQDLKKIEGISASYSAKKNDTESEKKEEQYTDKRKNTLTITFSGDNEYTIVPEFEDLAGNESGTVTYAAGTAPGTETHFVIDTTPPTVSVTYYDSEGRAVRDVGRSEKGRLYGKEHLRAVITVHEHNFSAGSSKFAEGQVVYTVTGVDKTGEEADIADYQSRAARRANWSQNVDEWTCTAMEFDTDANYTAVFRYTDLAGHTVTGRTDFFTVDTTAPTGSVTVGTLGRWKRLVQRVTFGLFARKSQKVTVQAEDRTSPVSEISTLVSAVPLSAQQLRESSDWVKTSRFSRKADEQFIVYARFVDQAGNTAYQSSDGAVLDATEPGPVIEITLDEEEREIFSGSVPFTVTVTDPVNGGTYSGLAAVHYEIQCDGAVTQSESYDVSYAKTAERTGKLTKNLRVDAEKNNSNDVKIVVTATDNAGNTAQTEKSLKIDTTRPTVRVSWNAVTARTGSFYGDIRIATVTVKERNFDENNVAFSITNTEGEAPLVSDWTHSENSGLSDSAVHTCTVTFSADGDYTFAVEVKDLADNTARTDSAAAFTIDRTAPVVRVEYDNSGASTSKGSYYRSSRTAVITITEHNFDPASVTEEITASLGGAGIGTPVQGEFSDVGDVHTATICYEADGDYTFTISCTDPAGNRSEEYETDRFTVDTEAPAIEIGGIGKANTDRFSPRITVTDNNYDAEQIQVRLTGVRNGTLETDCRTRSVADGEIFILPNLPDEEKWDDIYTIEVIAADRAGNVGTEEYTCSLNRFGSVYTYGDGLEELLGRGIVSEPMDLIIRETNTDSLTERWIVCSRNGESTLLREGSEYSVENSGTEEGWKSYTYTIFRENFREDGLYILTLYSEDAAGGTSGNQAREKTIEFILDQTEPTVVVLDVEGNTVYTQDRLEITLDVQDNIALDTVWVEVTDTEGRQMDRVRFSAEEAEESEGQLLYTLQNHDRRQNITVTAADLAGNRKGEKVEGVLLSTSRWVQFVNSPGRMAEAALVPAGFLFFFLDRKRRRGRRHFSSTDPSGQEGRTER